MCLMCPFAVVLDCGLGAVTVCPHTGQENVRKEYLRLLCLLPPVPYLFIAPLRHPQCEKPQSQITQPPSCRSFLPQSGQMALSSIIAKSTGSLPPAFSLGRTAGILPCARSTSSMVRAIASGQEVQPIPSCRIVEGQRIPFNWLRISVIATPERRATEVNRATASD